jgi:hypothetical protein
VGSLPGAPRSGVDPEMLREKLQELTVLVGKLMDSQEPAQNSPSITKEHPKCFIIMPFGKQDLEELYAEFLLPALRECELDCQRGDDIFGSNVIMEDVRTSISSADLIVADLTGQNPNVFYEVGIAHTLRKPVLLLSMSIEDIPFDLRHRRVLQYEYTPMGCKRLLAKLKQHVASMLGKP